MYGWMPIGLWALHRFFGSGSRWALATFGVVFLLQGLSNGYYLYFFALPVVAVIAFELWRRPEHRRRRMAQLGLAGALTLLVLAPVIAAYYEARSEQELVRSREDIATYSADVDSYLEGARALTVWGNTLSSVGPETNLFPGLALSLLAALGLGSVGFTVARAHIPRHTAPSLRPIGWLYIGIGTVALLLTLGPEPTAWGHRLPFSGPYGWLVGVIPGLDGLRVPARLAVVVYLALAVLAAVGMVEVVTRLTRRSGVIVVVLVSAVLVAEGYGGRMPVTPFEPHLALDDQRAYAWLSAAPPGAVLELPIQGDEPGDTLTFQYWTLQHRHPIVNGYSGYSTGLYSFLSRPSSPLFQHEQLDDMLRACRALGVRYVVVHAPFIDPETSRTTISTTIRRSQDQLLAVEDFDSTIVFWLADPDPLAEAPPNLRPVAASQFTATASHETRNLDRAFDDDLETGWRSGHEQTGTEWIELRLNRARNLGLVRFDMADGGLDDYPRSLTIESSDPNGPFSVLYQGDVVTQLTQGLVHGRIRHVGSTPIEIVLPENDTTTLRIRQTGQASDWAWSIDELSIWER